MDTSYTGLGHGISAERLSGDRLFLQQGPINLIIKAYGSGTEQAYKRVQNAFSGILDGLATELNALKQPLPDRLEMMPTLSGATAQRMLAATVSYRHYWVTPMAAVAGAVADTLAVALNPLLQQANGGIEKFFINNGGDIAFGIGSEQVLDIGIVPRIQDSAAASVPFVLSLQAAHGVGGLATSGWNGHSFSLGIADAVTVLAADAAAADVAATLIGNAVDAAHPGIERRPAIEIDPNSDLGERLVTVKVPPPGGLPQTVVDEALVQGTDFANELVQSGLIHGALLMLQNNMLQIGRIPTPTQMALKRVIK